MRHGDKHTPKCCTIFHLPFSLVVNLIFQHHHFRLTALDPRGSEFSQTNHFCSITPFSHDTEHNTNSQPSHTGENCSGTSLATNISLSASLSLSYFSQTLSLILFFSLSHSLTVSFSLCRSLFLFLSCSYTHELIQYCAVLYCTDKIG